MGLVDEVAYFLVHLGGEGVPHPSRLTLSHGIWFLKGATPDGARRVHFALPGFPTSSTEPVRPGLFAFKSARRPHPARSSFHRALVPGGIAEDLLGPCADFSRHAGHLRLHRRHDSRPLAERLDDPPAIRDQLVLIAADLD